MQCVYSIAMYSMRVLSVYMLYIVHYAVYPIAMHNNFAITFICVENPYSEM